MDLVLDAFLDSIKIWPILIVVYLLFEWIGNKRTNYMKNQKLGPVLGVLGGCIPQCGASVAAASLFATGAITLGTLVSVFISTSDEAIPLMLAYRSQWRVILLLLAVKVVYAIFIGVIIDALLPVKVHHQPVGNRGGGCSCKSRHLLLTALKRSLKVVIFLFIMTVVMNGVINFIGEDIIENWLVKTSVFQPLIAAGIGLIPNCVSSILITELYLQGMISFGSVVAGLCTGAGAGLLVLFKENKSLRENMSILLMLYSFGGIIGLILNMIL